MRKSTDPGRFSAGLPTTELTTEPTRPPRPMTLRELVWLVLVNFWVLAVLVAFVVIRLVGSSFGQSIVAKITHDHFR